MATTFDSDDCFEGSPGRSLDSTLDSALEDSPARSSSGLDNSHLSILEDSLNSSALGPLNSSSNSPVNDLHGDALSSAL